jgi:hypothetical protein
MRRAEGSTNTSRVTGAAAERPGGTSHVGETLAVDQSPPPLHNENIGGRGGGPGLELPQE